MSVIHHQALIIENDTLILRGPYESVKKSFDDLVMYRRSHRMSVNNLGLYTPYLLGFSDMEVSSMISYCIDHQNEKYFLGLAQMCINQDTNSMNRFLQFVLSQGY